MSDRCWRCFKESKTLLHIWTCTLIQAFWAQVHEIMTQVFTHSLEHTPAQLLLHHLTTPAHSYGKSLAIHMINAAKLCIPTHLGSPHTLNIHKWLKRISKNAELEELICIVIDTPAKFSCTWTDFNGTGSCQPHKLNVDFQTLDPDSCIISNQGHWASLPYPSDESGRSPV